MPLSDIVSVTILTSAQPAQVPGFGKPLILGLGGFFANSDIIRDYSSLTGMVSDGCSTTAPEYLAAAAMFGQNPRPPLISIGKRTHLPTLTWDISPVAIANALYGVTVNGNHLSYQGGSGVTVANITAALKTAIDALSIAGLTTTDNGGSTGKLHLAMGTAGAWLRVAVDDPAKLGIQQVNTDAGIATDLNAIALVRSDWYGVVSVSVSTAEFLALASAVESFNPVKIMLQHSQDSMIPTVAPSTDTAAAGSGSVAAQNQTAGNIRVGPLYHPDNGAMAGAAALAAWLPRTPGSETVKFMFLAGVPVVTLTDTQFENIKGKNCNYYTAFAGESIVGEGVTGDGEFLDVVRFRDWLAATMTGAIFTLMVQTQSTLGKIPYTDAGIGMIKNQILQVLQQGIQNGGLVLGSITVSVPLAANVSPTDKGNRALNNVTWSAELSGAIHAVNITGTVTF